MSDVADSTPEADQDLGWALGTLLRAYAKAAGDAVAELPGGPRAFQVLTLAAGNKCRNQAAIAEHLGIDRTVMTYLIDDLEGAGLVERKPDPADRRARQILITAKGRKTHSRLRERVAAVERHTFGRLKDDEVEMLRALLGRAARDVDAGLAPTDACRLVSELDLPG